MTRTSALVSIGMLCLALTACGGGGGASDSAAPLAAPTDPTQAARIKAATETANLNPACTTSALPEGYYWEIGDRDGVRASGTVAGSSTPAANQVIALASSSKWIYSTYVLQKLGTVRDDDVPFLNFTSGYVYPLLGGATKELLCKPLETVGECAADATQQPAAVGKFYYSAGHFQYHAAHRMGLASMGAVALTKEVTDRVGAFDFVYLQTNLAGGMNASAAGYAGFLRRMLRGDYTMAARLGSHQVCASAACGSGAVLSPAPADEAWNYSLGHWVEDDPNVGDHAFSSPGALGFYPWIDATKTWYGVLARRATQPGSQEGVKSLTCGRLIRQAWVTGVAVTKTTSPTPSR